MRLALIVLIVGVVLLGGTFMGIASMFLVPLIASIALLVLLIWLVQRRSSGRRPPLD